MGIDDSCSIGNPVTPDEVDELLRSRMKILGLVWGDWCQGCCEDHLLVRSASDISSSRPNFPADAARSDRQGRSKAVAQRHALDGREHSVKLRQSGDTGVSRSFSSISTTATLPRGARQRARVARHELVFGRPRRSHHDAVMRIGGEAPRGGPILNRGAKAIVQRRWPPPRAVVYRSSIVVTLACSNSVVVTPPDEAGDLPALRRSWRAATAR
jgi:hypothetical protein